MPRFGRLGQTFNARRPYQSILLVALLGAAYSITLLPGVGYSGDTAGFQFVGRVLGITHPTGSPLYTLLNHLVVQYLAWGSHAWRANLLSSVLAVVSCVILGRLLGRLGVDNRLASVTALAYGLSRTFWSQAVVAEVYTLNILFMVVVLDRLVAWQQSHHERDLLTACAFYALSFGNHLSMIFLLPGLVAFIWSVDRTVFRNSRIVATVLCLAILGMSQYLYLLLRSHDPSLRFSEMFPGDFRDFIIYITGGPFRKRMLSFSPEQVLRFRIPMLARLAARELLVAIPLFVLGIFRVGNRPVQLLLGLTFLTSIVYGLGYNVDDVWVFFMPAYLIAFIYIGVGLEDLLRSSGRRANVLVYSTVLVPLTFGLFNYSRANRSTDVALDKAVVQALETAHADAAILSPSQMISESFWYYLVGEGIETQRRLYVVHHVDPKAVASYIRRAQTFQLLEERRPLPPGLVVYDWAGSHRAVLESAGLRLVPAGGELYRVE